MSHFYNESPNPVYIQIVYKLFFKRTLLRSEALLLILTKKILGQSLPFLERVLLYSQ